MNKKTTAEEILEKLLKRTDQYKDVGVSNHVELDKELLILTLNSGGYIVEIDITKEQYKYLKILKGDKNDKNN